MARMMRAVTAPATTENPKPRFLRLRRTVREPEEFTDVATGIDLRVDYRKRLEKASVVEHFLSPAWAMDLGRMHVGTRACGVLHDGWASLCFNIGPASARWNGRAAGIRSIGLLPPGGEVDGCTEPGYHYLTMAIPAAQWMRCVAAARGGRAVSDGLVVAELPSETFGKWRRRIGRALEILRSPGREAMAEDRIFNAGAALVLDCFLEAGEAVIGPVPGGDGTRNRLRLARRADAWMRGNLGEVFSVLEMCRAMGVSRRELEYAFRAAFDQSPRRHLELLRLNAARRALKNAEPGRDTVASIALEHGFLHAGRFAASYQALFGEKPSATAGWRRAG